MDLVGLSEDAEQKLNLAEGGGKRERVIPGLGSLVEAEESLMKDIDELEDLMKQISEQTKVGLLLLLLMHNHVHA